MKYTLQFKTGDAEIRALKNIPKEIYSNTDFSLLVELTRGRKSKKDNIGDLNKRISSLQTFIPSNANMFLDVTSDTNLSNEQIDELYSIDHGYGNWCSLFSELQGYFINATPMLLVTDSDKGYDNFKRQIEYFATKYKKVGYKICPGIGQEIIEKEIRLLASELKNDSDVIVTVFYDQGYIVDGLIEIAKTAAVDYLGLVSGLLPNLPYVNYVLISTSFPDSVTSLSGKETGVINCTEHNLYDSVINSATNVSISYADCGSVTPKRNDDGAFYGNGWTPRIDVPFSAKAIYYYREKRANRDYADVYVDVAKRCIGDNRYPDIDCWGCQIIRNAAQGMKPGSNPSFWLSVRMNIYVYQQLKKLAII